MAYKDVRSLRIESLENRQVLSAGPISADIQLVSFDPSTGNISTTQNSESQPVMTNSHRAARNEVLTPFLTGDFSGDGVTDLLARDSGDNSWWLQLNDGTQLFELPIGDGINNREIIGAADFNQDQRLDVATIDTSTNELWIAINTIDGFAHQRWGSFSIFASLDEIHIGDFSGNGRIDILSGETGGAWYLAENQTGTNFTVQEWGVFLDFDWQEIVTGKFNNDGIADVAALAPDNTWWLWQGGGGGFGNANYFGHSKSAVGWEDIGVGDFNGDGFDDVIGRTPDGKLHVGSTEGNKFNTWIWGSGWIDSADWRNVEVRDLNGDGLADQLSQAKDGTWWYAISDGFTFTNYYWQRATNVDFVLTNFRSPAIDTIDSMPENGVDVRGIEVSAILNNQGRFEIRANAPLQVEGITFTSASGSLVPKSGGGAAQPGASGFQVTYGRIAPRLSSWPLRLDVGWDMTGTPDLVANITIGSTVLPIRVQRSIGPAVSNVDVSAEVANEIYFSTLPASNFLPAIGLTETLNQSTANTISLDNAKLLVERNSSNRIVLTPVEPLLLTGVELRSPSGSLIPLAGNGPTLLADPFLSAIVNSSSRIILESEDWPLLVTDELVLDIAWLPNATASDLIVEYRVAGDSGTYQAYVSEPLRLPFVETVAPNTVKSLGPIRLA